MGHLRAQGASDFHVWAYALADVRDRGAKAALRWLIEAGIAPPPELRREVADAVEGVGLYRRGKGMPAAHNGIERELVLQSWRRFCAEWTANHPDDLPPKHKWIELFRESIRVAAIGMGATAPTDTELVAMAPTTSLLRLIDDDPEVTLA